MTHFLDSGITDRGLQNTDASRQITSTIVAVSAYLDTATVVARPSAASATSVETLPRVVVTGVVTVSVPFLKSVELYPEAWRLKLGLDSCAAEALWAI